MRALFSLIIFALAGEVCAQESCVYVDGQGVIKQADSKTAIPSQFRAQSRCFNAKSINQVMAAPEEIKLKGTVRTETLSSALGPVEMRWPRKVEQLFGRTPERAVAEAATAVSRALKQAGFPLELQTMTANWQIVFMDEEVPETQIPTFLVTNCHPAWMTPEANIYVVAQRVVAGCGGGARGTSSSVNDAQLAQVLIHEMGHAVEYKLLGPSGFATADRVRPEGFACWFEQYASDFSYVIPKGSVSRLYEQIAQQAIAASPDVFTFSGTIDDYARAAMNFKAVQSRRGVYGIIDVYKTMREQHLDLASAIRSAVGWDQKKLAAEIARLLDS